MSFSRVAFVLLVPVLSASLTPLSGAPSESTEFPRRVYFTPATPLNEIPLYTLDSAAPGAMRSLESEIERLYRYATTLPSGPDRRAFESRIYQLEKQLGPLAKSFDASAWTNLRDAVKNEWIAVQATLPTAKPAAEAAQKSPPVGSGAPLAASNR